MTRNLDGQSLGRASSGSIDEGSKLTKVEATMLLRRKLYKGRIKDGLFRPSPMAVLTRPEHVKCDPLCRSVVGWEVTLPLCQMWPLQGASSHFLNDRKAEAHIYMVEELGAWEQELSCYACHTQRREAFGDSGCRKSVGG